MITDRRSFFATIAALFGAKHLPAIEPPKQEKAPAGVDLAVPGWKNFAFTRTLYNETVEFTTTYPVAVKLLAGQQMKIELPAIFGDNPRFGKVREIRYEVTNNNPTNNNLETHVTVDLIPEIPPVITHFYYHGCDVRLSGLQVADLVKAMTSSIRQSGLQL